MTALVMQRMFRAELQATDDRTVEGCVVPYGEAARVQDVDPDTGEVSSPYWEVWEPGAFRKQLRAATRLELRYEHRDDLASSVGVCRSLSDEASGCFGAFRIHEGAMGDQALALTREGILAGFSVEFLDRFRNWQRTPEGTVVRRSCELLSVGLTRIPAYKGAQVVAVRSRADFETEYELPPIDAEQLDRLRQLGVQV